MKKRLAFALAILLCLSLLAGCKDTQENETIHENTSNTDKKSTAPAMEETILKDRVAYADNDNLYTIPLEVLDGVALSLVYRYGNDLLLTYSVYDISRKENNYHVCLVSIETGEVQKEQQLKISSDAVAQILEDGIGIYDAASGAIVMLDEELSVVSEYKVDGKVLCLHPTQNEAYVESGTGGLVAIDLATMEQTEIVSSAKDVEVYAVNASSVALSYVDTDTLLRVSGIMDFVDDNGRGLEPSMAASTLAATVAPSKYPLSKGAFSLPEGAEYRMNFDTEQMVLAELHIEETAPITAYKMDGSFVSSCDGAGLANTTMSQLQWFEEYNGYLFTAMSNEGESQLLFWDITQPSGGQNLVMEDTSALHMDIPEGTALSKELYEQAAQISNTYGVELLIGEQCMTEFPDHRGNLLLTEADVALALDTIDHVLGSYPEGFFEQLRHDSYYQMEIHVLGTLEKSSSTDDVIYISGGFVNPTYAGKLVMALDARAGFPGESINSLLAQTMYHELSHVIDKRLAFDSLYREDAYYTEDGWRALNPEGFEYNWSYYGTLDPAYASYFVDAYACTNETEDRARTMEYACIDSKSTYAGKAGLQAKLDYYAKGIRDSFDTTGWPEVLLWEQVLQ